MARLETSPIHSGGRFCQAREHRGDAGPGRATDPPTRLIAQNFARAGVCHMLVRRLASDRISDGVPP
jgi:hypothetical protein